MELAGFNENKRMEDFYKIFILHGVSDENIKEAIEARKKEGKFDFGTDKFFRRVLIDLLTKPVFDRLDSEQFRGLIEILKQEKYNPILFSQRDDIIEDAEFWQIQEDERAGTGTDG